MDLVYLCIIGLAFILYGYIKILFEEKESIKLHRKCGDAFRVYFSLGMEKHREWIYLHKKKHREWIYFHKKKHREWIYFHEKVLSIKSTYITDGYEQGTTHVIDSRNIIVGYGDIITVKNITKEKFCEDAEYIGVYFNYSGHVYNLILRAAEVQDTNIIRKTIDNNIARRRREIEVDKLMRARYKAGLFDGISPSDFEKVIEELFANMGYSTMAGYITMRVGRTGDGGVDLRCRSLSSGERIIVQCKRFSGNVGARIVREFYGALVDSKATKGYIITTGGFTREAREWAKDKPIELIDRKRLSDLMMKYYR